MPVNPSRDRSYWKAILAQWSDSLLHDPGREEAIDRAQQGNPWFIAEDVSFALDSIALDLLDSNALDRWLGAYPEVDQPRTAKTIGLVLAGNIPLVGFHDLLCVLVSGHVAQYKCSSKDQVLLTWALECLSALDPQLKGCWYPVERLEGIDAVIATGSENSGRYFRYYFGRYPHLIRGSRSSVAILDGSESPADLRALGEDVFRYFGLGCRSISQLWLPPGFDLEKLLPAFEPFRNRLQHPRYSHNMDYQRTLLLMNRIPFAGNDFLSLVESEQLVSPISVLHYRYWKEETERLSFMEEVAEKVQVFSGRFSGCVPFGHCQRPGPGDYADNLDTLRFLLNL